MTNMMATNAACSPTLEGNANDPEMTKVPE
jgi:hypothetical protein